MNKLNQTLAFAFLATLPLGAVPTVTPSKPAEIRAEVISVTKVRGEEGLSIVSLKDYQGIDHNTAKRIYKAIRGAGFDVRYPRRTKMDLLLRNDQTKGIKAGDRVQIEFYELYGHTFHRGIRLSTRVNLKKNPK